MNANRRSAQLIASVGLALSAFAQTPAFDVVSIKPSLPTNRFAMSPLPGGKFTATGAVVRVLLEAAYGLQDYQISGAPDWVMNERFDITAHAGHDITLDEMRLMLRSMLEDRFKLKIQKKTRETQVYALLVSKGGFTLAPSVNPDLRSGLMGVRGKTIGKRATMAQLAQSLSNTFGKPVLDKTGVSGQYDFTLEYDPPLHVRDTLDDLAPSIFTAVQEQLGLKLESQNGPEEFYVIEHIERPSEN